MKTLIFLHGWTSHKDNLAIINNLCEQMHIRFYSFDFLMHGVHKQASYDYNVDFVTLVRQAQHELKNFYDDEVILVGHSMGGAIALLLQQEFQNIKKLILIDPLTPNQDEDFINKIKDQLKPGTKHHEEKKLTTTEDSRWKDDVHRFMDKLNEYSKENRLAIIKLFASFKSKKFKALFDHLTTSAGTMWYLIQGTNDQFLNSHKTVSWLQALREDIEVNLIPDADHSPFKSQPEVFLKIIQRIFQN